VARSTPRSRPADRQLRVRARTLDEVDESKLALALWLMAKRLIEERRQAAASPASDDVSSPERREVA
jgi:hypothetical protein